jgi:hypothetical protein
VVKGAFLVVVLAASACKPQLEDELSLVTSPRVLAVRATPAESDPAAGAEFETLFADASGTRTDAEVSWSFCLARKPLSELGPIAPECRDPSSPERSFIGEGLTATAPLPADACRLFGPQLPEPKPGEPAGRPVDPDSTGGFYQPVVLDVAEGKYALGIFGARLGCPLSGVSQEESIAFERAYRPNQNPEPGAIRAGEQVLSTTNPNPIAAGSVLELEVAWNECPATSACGDGLCTSGEDTTTCPDDCTTPVGCTGAERYARFDPETRVLGTKREWIRVSWFTNQGQLSEERTGREEDDPATFSRNRWQAPSATGEATVWIVLRDARGGVGWRSLRFAIE